MILDNLFVNSFDDGPIKSESIDRQNSGPPKIRRDKLISSS